MIDIDIKTATQEQLLWFATNVMAIEAIEDGESAEQIRAKLITAGWERSYISVNKTGEPVGVEVAVKQDPAPTDHLGPDGPVVDSITGETAAATKRRMETSGKNDPKLKIFIPKQPGIGGDRAIPVGVNGTHILLPREQEIDVALRYVLVLHNAVQTEYTPVEDNPGEFTSRNVQLYPFQVLEGREHLLAAQ